MAASFSTMATTGFPLFMNAALFLPPIAATVAGSGSAVTCPLVLCRPDPEQHAHAHQLGHRAGPQLFHHGLALGLDGAFGVAQRVGDLLVQLAAYHQREHLMLAR